MHNIVDVCHLSRSRAADNEKCVFEIDVCIDQKILFITFQVLENPVYYYNLQIRDSSLYMI